MRYMTAGESHGPVLTAIIEGFPAGLTVDEALLNHNLARRQAGVGRGKRMTIEHDLVQFTAGVRHGITLGSPITMTILNHDFENWQATMNSEPDDGDNEKLRVTRPRPGHADLVGGFKYHHRDLRNVLERSSARETAMRVAIGALCQQLLAKLNIQVLGFVTGIGGIKSNLTLLNQLSMNEIAKLTDNSLLRTFDTDAENKMLARIQTAKSKGDTLGGQIQVIGTGLPVGLGSYATAAGKLDGRIAQAIISVNAIKGVSFGDGNELGDAPGSAVMDEIFWDDDGFYRKTNHLGGFEGGMTNGMPIIVNATMKPIPTLMRPLASVDINTKEPTTGSIQRSDTTAVPAAAVVAEAMVAITITKVLLETFDDTSVERLIQQFKTYVTEWKNY